MANKMQLRRGTASAWTAANTVLLAGEIGYETDTSKFKIGDGSTAWSGLTYFSAGGGGGTVTASSITDSTTVGRAVLTAANAAAARTAMGAGNVNGTGIDSIVVMTQSAYNALTPKVSTTLYVIQG